MAVSGRHIRHDWQTFVDWDQKSVSTVCGRKSTFNYTGIPGVTEQESVVLVSGGKASGWCVNCAYIVHTTSKNVLATGRLHPYMVAMYEDVLIRTTAAYETYVALMRRRAI